MKRVGFVGIKLGMSSYYNQLGYRVPVTLVKAASCQVVGVKTRSKNGYDAVQVGYCDVKSKNLNKPQRSFYNKHSLDLKRHIIEFRVSEDCFLKVSDKIGVDHFVVGQYVDVRGKSKGKGFAGGMKRHGFKGLEATHGVSVSHRSIGSTGQCQDPGKVFKGKKMPGQLGDKKVCIQNIEIIDICDEVMFLNGSVPSSKGGFVFITDSIKKLLPEGVKSNGSGVSDEVQVLDQGKVVNEE